jgi:hypothetical protein
MPTLVYPVTAFKLEQRQNLSFSCPSFPRYQDLARTRGAATAQGWASSPFTSALVAALTPLRVMVRDRFVFSMVHIVTGDLLVSVSSGTPVPSFTRNLAVSRLAPD